MFHQINSVEEVAHIPVGEAVSETDDMSATCGLQEEVAEPGTGQGDHQAVAWEAGAALGPQEEVPPHALPLQGQTEGRPAPSHGLEGRIGCN